MIRPPDKPCDERRKQAAKTVATLSPRQREVLDGLLAGENEKQVSIRLKISHHTVHQYIKELHRKFGVQSRGELTSLFIAPPNNGTASPDGPSHELVGLSRVSGLIPPERNAPEAEHVVFCMKLLENRGFVVRYVEATRAFVRRRRGLSVSMLLAVVVGTLAVRTIDLSRAVEPVREELVAEPPRLLDIMVHPDGQWLQEGRAELWEKVAWHTSPPDSNVEVRVRNRLLQPADPNVIVTPGPIYVRYPEGQSPVIVHLVIERSSRQMASR